jgi:PmbA protein
MMPTDLNQIADELASFAELGVKKARTKGAEESEVFVSNIDELTINMKTAIVEARQGVSLGLGIRVVLDGKVGFAATSGIDEEKIDHTVKEAIEVARIRPLDKKFSHLADPISIPSKDGIIDNKVLEFTEMDALEEINTLSKVAFEYDKRVKALYGGIGVEKAVYAVANSRGIASCSMRAIIGGGVYLTAIENGKRKTGLESIDSRKLVDFQKTGIKAAQRAIKMLEAKPLNRSFRTTVIWENTATDVLLKGMLSAASSAQNVQEGKSFFKGKRGEKVASDVSTIIDDGQLQEGLQTFNTDSEGVPSQTTTLIEKGFLKEYIYDSYSAIQENRHSTGNAGRKWPEPFLSMPQISTSNLVVKPGKLDLNGLIGNVKEGILVTDFVMGAGHANMTTGEFSVVAPNAFLIKSGEANQPLEPITIAGNFFHSLNDITEIGSDPRITSVGKIPSMIIQNLTVSG